MYFLMHKITSPLFYLSPILQSILLYQQVSCQNILLRSLPTVAREAKSMRSSDLHTLVELNLHYFRSSIILLSVCRPDNHSES